MLSSDSASKTSRRLPGESGVSVRLSPQAFSSPSVCKDEGSGNAPSRGRLRLHEGAGAGRRPGSRPSWAAAAEQAPGAGSQRTSARSRGSPIAAPDAPGCTPRSPNASRVAPSQGSLCCPLPNRRMRTTPSIVVGSSPVSVGGAGRAVDRREVRRASDLLAHRSTG